MPPFILRLFQDNADSPSTRVSASSDLVSSGNVLIVEHISGYFTVGG